LLIYSSNIFAVLGLRSLFFLLQGAASRFSYLQQGIAVVLLFIGMKMLVKKLGHIPAWACINDDSGLYRRFNPLVHFQER
jgi:tellurite resistance protein TerC